MTELVAQRVQSVWSKVAARFAAGTERAELAALVRPLEADAEGRDLVELRVGGGAGFGRSVAAVLEHVYELRAAPHDLAVGAGSLAMAQLDAVERWATDEVVAAERTWLLGVLAAHGSASAEPTFDAEACAALVQSGQRVVAPVAIESRLKKAGVSYVVGTDASVRTVPPGFRYARLRPFELAWRRTEEDDRVQLVASARVHLSRWDATQSVHYARVDPALTIG